MRRKVILLAGKTFVISIPSKWARKNNIKKGEELDIIESDSRLEIALLQRNVQTSVCIDVSDLNSSLLWHYLVSAYVKGIEEIELKFSDKEIFNPRTQLKVSTIKFIANVVSSLIGMELVRHGNSFCIIKEVSSIKPDEFNSVLKRLFFNICTISSDCLEAIKSKDNFILENCKYIEENINRLSAFCLRAINKGICTKNTQVSTYTSLIVLLEEIGDCYFAITNMLLKNSQLAKNQIEFFESTDFLLHNLFKLFYDFDKSKCISFYQDCKNLKSKLESATINSKNSVLIHILFSIEAKCKSVLGTRIELSV